MLLRKGLLRSLSALALSSALVSPYANARPPSSFEESKVILRQEIYFDQNRTDPGDLYCGCKWQWKGRSGGVMDLASCGYQADSQPDRAQRLEYEHIVPAAMLGNQRQCWQRGGRTNCTSTDAVYRAMEADLHNLAPTIGEVNAERSNFRYGMVTGYDGQFGACQTKVDQGQRIAEPRDEVKGMVARTTFYMADRYGIQLSRQQQQLLVAWDRRFPVSAWERARDLRIAKVAGNSNPFVTGEKTWRLGILGAATEETRRPTQHIDLAAASISTEPAVIGNRNSRVYHLSSGVSSPENRTAISRVFWQN